MRARTEKQMSIDWHVVRTNSMAEKKVAFRLKQLDIETYLPLYPSIRIWSDRKKKIEKPLIPSVVFIRLSAAELGTVYGVPGVAGILKYLGKPAVVREEEIRSLQLLTQNPDAVEHYACDRLEAGTPVEVIRGPFQGIIGIATGNQQQFCVSVELESIRSGFRLSVPRSHVRKV